MNRRIALLVCSALLGCARAKTAARGEVRESEGRRFLVETLLEDRGVLWGFDFLPDGRAILTERGGRFLVFDATKGTVTPLKGAPKVQAEGQGGLLDVRVHPGFAKNRLVYFTYSEPTGKGEATTTLARGKLDGVRLEEIRTICQANARSDQEVHFGSRLEFDGPDHVFFTVGDRNQRPRVQDDAFHNGKLLRVAADGSAAPEVWAKGLRSPQGLARQPKTGDLWEGEMGPRGGDEINVIAKGANYGWPVITYGSEYHGPKIGEGTAKAGMRQPVAHYVPSISPSGMSFYAGREFPAWEGNLFVGTLSGQHLRRVVLDGRRVVRQETLLNDLHWRIRNVRPGPDGFLYLSTDEGRFARLVPAK